MVTLGVAGGVLAWTLLLLVVPYAAAHDRLEGWRAAVATATYVVGGLVCHQQPDRSFRLGGTQMPVCARCTGLYGAAPVGLLAVTTAGRRRRRPGSSRPSWAGWLRVARLVLLVSAIPTATTWGAEQLGLISPSNGVRALAALPLGFCLAALVGLALTGALEAPRPAGSSAGPTR